MRVELNHKKTPASLAHTNAMVCNGDNERLLIIDGKHHLGIHRHFEPVRVDGFGPWTGYINALGNYIWICRTTNQ